MPARVSVACVAASMLSLACGAQKLGQCNLIVNAIGGVNLKEPASDLAMAVAIASSFFESEVASDTIVLGELGAPGRTYAPICHSNQAQLACSAGGQPMQGLSRRCCAGLGGELRAVPHAEKRVLEAAKLGYRQAVVPAVSAIKPSARLEGIRLLSCRTIADAFDAVFGEGFSSRQQATGKAAAGRLPPELSEEDDF